MIEVRHSEFKKCLESVARRSKFDEKHGKLPYGRGIGMAGGHYSTGGAFLLYPSYRPHSTAKIRVDTEAGVTLYIGATAIGQGAATVLCQMTAEMLGVDYRDVHLVCQDTMLAPYGQRHVRQPPDLRRRPRDQAGGRWRCAGSSSR